LEPCRPVQNDPSTLGHWHQGYTNSVRKGQVKADKQYGHGPFLRGDKLAFRIPRHRYLRTTVCLCVNPRMAIQMRSVMDHPDNADNGHKVLKCNLTGSVPLPVYTFIARFLARSYGICANIGTSRTSGACKTSAGQQRRIV